MRTINLSVLQRYNRERIREELSKWMGFAQKDRSDQIDGSDPGSNREQPANQLYAGENLGPNVSADHEPERNDINHRNAFDGSVAGNSGKHNPFVSKEKETQEGLETGLKNHTAREEIRSNLGIEVNRIKPEQIGQLQDIETDLINNQGNNQVAREQAEIEINTKRQQAKLQAERELLAEEARVSDLRNQMEHQKLVLRKMQLDQESRFVKNREREHQLAVAQRKEKAEAHRQKINLIFRTFLLTLFTLLLLTVLAAITYRMWRWSVEEPLIKEVVEEVVVEKRVTEEVIKEVEVEKEVIPPECTQIRRNGQVYVSCDGVTINGSPTISESGVEVPELLGDPNQYNL